MSPSLTPGLCSVTFRALPPERVIELAVRAGLRAIEWGGDVHMPPGDPTAARALGRATRAAGLAVSSYGSYLRPPDGDPETWDAAVASAQSLGAPMIRIWPGRRDRPSENYDLPQRAEAARAIRAIAEMAGRRGLAVGLEYHPGTLTDDDASALALLEEVDRRNVHLYWQPRPGLDPDTALSELRRLSPHVAHFHVFHWDQAARRFPLVDGTAQWRRYLAALPRSRYPGSRYAMIEFVAGDSEAQLMADARTLTFDLLEQAGEG